MSSGWRMERVSSMSFLTGYFVRAHLAVLVDPARWPARQAKFAGDLGLGSGALCICDARQVETRTTVEVWGEWPEMNLSIHKKARWNGWLHRYYTVVTQCSLRSVEMCRRSVARGTDSPVAFRLTMICMISGYLGIRQRMSMLQQGDRQSSGLIIEGCCPQSVVPMHRGRAWESSQLDRVGCQSFAQRPFLLLLSTIFWRHS